MKKNIIALVIAFSSVTMLTSCGSNSSKEKQSTTKEVAAVEYTCPMHTEVKSDKPGDCPQCGMALVERKDKE